MVKACKEFKEEESLRETYEKGLIVNLLNHKLVVNCVKVWSGLGDKTLSIRVVPRI